MERCVKNITKFIGWAFFVYVVFVFLFLIVCGVVAYAGGNFQKFYNMLMSV